MTPEQIAALREVAGDTMLYRDEAQFLADSVSRLHGGPGWIAGKRHAGCMSATNAVRESRALASAAAHLAYSVAYRVAP